MKSISILTALAIILLVTACGDEKASEPVLLVPETIAVKTLQVAAHESSGGISTTGLITTENEAKYAFLTDGVIDNIFVREGDSFRKGQLLATLQMTAIESGLTQAKLALDKANRDYERVENLHRDSVATLEQLQNTETAVQIAEKQVESIQFTREFSSIYATADGFVTKKLANEGEVISGGSPVFWIQERNGKSPWILRAGVTDREWAQIKIGQSATVQVDAFPDEIFTATVSNKSQISDGMSGSFQVELRLQTNGIKPAVGMYAKATIATGAANTAIRIPYSALIEADGNDAFLFTPNQPNGVRKIKVKIKSFDNKEVLVEPFDEEITEVIIANSAFLNAQSTIQIIK